MSTRDSTNARSPRDERRKQNEDRKRRIDSGKNLRQGHKKKNRSAPSAMTQPKKRAEKTRQIAHKKKPPRTLPTNKNKAFVESPEESVEEEEEEDEEDGSNGTSMPQSGTSKKQIGSGDRTLEDDDDEVGGQNYGEDSSGQGVAFARSKDVDIEDNDIDDNNDDDEEPRKINWLHTKRRGGGRLKNSENYNYGSDDNKSEEGDKHREDRRMIKAKTSARRQMETYGFFATEKQAISAVERFTRDTVFHKIHMATEDNMHHRGPAAMLVFRFLNFDNSKQTDRDRFTALWIREKGLRQFVVRALNEKRSRVTRWIQKDILGYEKDNMESTFDTDDRVEPNEQGWKKLIELRKNKEVMKWIVEKAIVYVVGKKEYNKKIGTELLSKWCNVGDEAMAMTMLENSWNLWCHRYNNGETSQDEVTRKWSTWREDKRKQKRWDPKGTTEFYRWRTRVKESRNEDGNDFDNWLLESVSKDGRKQRKSVNLSREWEKDRATVHIEYDLDDEETMVGWGRTAEI